jgi:hypothetical protein
MPRQVILWELVPSPGCLGTVHASPEKFAMLGWSFLLLVVALQRVCGTQQLTLTSTALAITRWSANHNWAGLRRDGIF